jgi:DNA-binding NtrC family response regulator
MPEPAHVLFIDDDEGLREIVTMQLEDGGLRVTACAGGASGIAAFQAEPPDVVLTDLKMPDVDGMQVLRAIHRLDADVPVLVATAFGSVATAVAAMQAGAHDYITKPVSGDALLLKLRRAIEHGRVVRENRELRTRVEASGQRPMLVISEAMERLVEQVRRVAPADLPVLLTGESGTGKELIARELHRASNRSGGPFLAVNCRAARGRALRAHPRRVHRRGEGAGRALPGGGGGDAPAR